MKCAHMLGINRNLVVTFKALWVNRFTGKCVRKSTYLLFFVYGKLDTEFTDHCCLRSDGKIAKNLHRYMLEIIFF